MTDLITEKAVEMTADDWASAADEAIGHAVGWLRQDAMVGRAGALVKAAELLRAADAFNGRANMMKLCDEVPDRTTIEVM